MAAYSPDRGTASPGAAAPENPSRQVFVGIVLSVAGSLFGTWVGKAVYGTPALNLLAAVLGALVPVLLPELLPRNRTHPLMASVVVLIAVLLTYASVTTANYVSSASPTFPLPPGAPAPAATGDGRGPTTGPGIEVTPDALPCQGIGTCGSVTIRSTGTAALEVTAIRSEPPDGFAVEGDCGEGAYQPGEQCTFEVVSLQENLGAEIEARLLIDHNVPDVDTAVSLVSATAPIPLITVTPEILRCEGRGSCGQVALSSTGTSPLRVDEIEIDGSGAGNFGFAQNCANRTYEPGALCAFEVVLVDESPGEETEARLVIHQNLPGDPSYVDLVGVP